MSWKTLMDGDDLLKARKAGDTGYWWVLGSTDLLDACGEEEAAEMSGSKRMPIMGDLSLVPGKALVSEEQQKNVLGSCGWEDAPDTDEVWVEMANSYGLRVHINTAFGGTNESALRKTLKEACVDLDGSVKHHLDRTINRLGQTGHESLAGDMTSCLDRAIAKEHDDTADRLKNATMRSVKQRNLSSECWTVQVWGLHECKTCEYRNGADCGGKSIRKTGKNEHGHSVPVS